MQVEASGIAINDHQLHNVLGYADDLNILSESIEGALGLTTALERTVVKIGLRTNVDKTKII